MSTEKWKPGDRVYVTPQPQHAPDYRMPGEIEGPHIDRITGEAVENVWDVRLTGNEGPSSDSTPEESLQPRLTESMYWTP